MSQFLEDLKEFLSNSEDFSQATHDVEREVNEKMAEAIEADRRLKHDTPVLASATVATAVSHPVAARPML